MYKIINKDLIYSKLPEELFNIIWGNIKYLSIEIIFNDFEMSSEDVICWFCWNRCNHMFSNEYVF